MISAHGKPSDRDSYPIGQLYVDMDSNTVWVRCVSGWVTTLIDSPVFFAGATPEPNQEPEPRRRRVFDFE